MQFGSLNRCDGLVPALRTHDELLWVCILNIHGVPVMSRCLHPVERLSLQGSRTELPNFLSKADLLRATGNAFSVPIVTSVVRECLMLLAAPHLLGAVGLPASLPGGWLVPSDMEEHLRKRRRLNIERSRLAISELRFVLLSHRRDR